MSFKIENNKLTKYIPDEGETEIIIPDGVKIIGKWAFEGCENLTSITIPDSVTSIEACAFMDCTNLTNITLPDSVTSIGYYALAYCENITNITIPEGLTCGVEICFDTNVGLTEISVDANNEKYASIEGVLYNKDKTKLLLYPRMKKENNFVIPDSVTSIESPAFACCKNLTSITIPDSVTSIGDRAFEGCTNLTSITIPDSVTSIEEGLFWGCTNLTNITIPDSVTSIGERAFYDCKNLANISIPDNIKSIGLEAFDNCNINLSVTLPEISIKEINFDKKVAIKGFILNRDKFTNPAIVEDYKKYSFRMKKTILADAFSTDSVELLKYYIDNGKINKSNFDSDYFQPAQNANATECVSYLLDWKDKHITFEDEMKQLNRELNKDPFNVTDMKKIWSFSTLEDGTIEITGYRGKEEDITVPERIGKKTVTSIAAKAFSSHKIGVRLERAKVLENIKSVTIPDSVEYIGDYAFYECCSLINVFIGKGVKRNGTKIFCNCYNLISIDIPEGFTTELEECFDECNSLTEINVDANNEKYASIDGVLYNKDKTKLLLYPRMKKESNFIIPDSVTSIESLAFKNCRNLTNITIPDSVTSIGKSAFSDCTNLTNITIPDSVTSIGNDAFAKCSNLTSITIPDSVTGIGDDAFSGCQNLKEINVDINNKKYTSIDGVLYNKNKTMLLVYPQMKKENSFVVPDSVISIEECSFELCKNLTNITIPDSVKVIKNYAFAYCKNLEKILIPPSIKRIERCVFKSCKRITIFTTKDSYAAKYAREYDIKLRIVEL